jgi:hypothetical protein
MSPLMPGPAPIRCVNCGRETYRTASGRGPWGDHRLVVEGLEA